MNTTRRGGLNSTALALIPLAIAINIAVAQIVKLLKVPIYLDSIGTVLVGALMGPWVGAIAGALTNVIYTLTGLDPIAYAFAPVAALIGLIAGFAGQWGVFQRPSPPWLSALVGGFFLFALSLVIMMFANATTDPEGATLFPSAVDLIQQQPIIFIVATLVGLLAGFFVFQRAGYAMLAGMVTGAVALVISAPIVTYLFGGVTGTGTDAVVAAFRGSGATILEATIAQGIVSDPGDKMITYLVVYLIVQSLPRRLLQRFPNARAVEEPQRVAKPATSR